MSKGIKDRQLAKILEEILVEGDFYRKHCHRCMYWHPKRGCSLSWHGCYHVQEELENRIEKAMKQEENGITCRNCGTCPYQKHRKNCRLICTRKVLDKQDIHFPEVAIGSI